MNIASDIHTIECGSARDAIQEVDAGGRVEAVLLDGKPMVAP